MNFDTRARRAAQGIHRAVEVMEMSSTKTPQRPARFDQYRERKSRNQRIAALAIGITVPVVLISLVLVLRSDSNPGVPLTAPSVTPTSVSGRSHTFKAPFTYTVPSDWTFSGDGRRYFSLETPGAYGTDVIALSSVVAAAPDCSYRPAQGVGTSSEAMTRWLTTHPAFDATTPRPVRLGVATGSYVDVQLAADWSQTCGPLGLLTGHPDAPQTWDIGSEEMRLYVLDLPSGDTVTIVIDPRLSASDFQSLIAQAAPVVESFDFLK
jgi:hypothetical protein